MRDHNLFMNKIHFMIKQNLIFAYFYQKMCLLIKFRNMLLSLLRTILSTDYKNFQINLGNYSNVIFYILILEQN